jgi:hypothetical protein
LPTPFVQSLPGDVPTHCAYGSSMWDELFQGQANLFLSYCSSAQVRVRGAEPALRDGGNQRTERRWGKNAPGDILRAFRREVSGPGVG